MHTSKSEWFGDEQNGIELRKNVDGTPDEMILYVGGESVAILEQMDQGHWWLGFYPPGVDRVTANLVTSDGEEVPITAIVEQD